MLDLYQYNDFIYLVVVITESAKPLQLLENWEEYGETDMYD